MWCRLAVGPRAPSCAGGGGWWCGGAWGRAGSAGSVLVGRVLVVGLGMGALLLWADGRAVGFTSNTRGPPLGGCRPLPWWGVVAPSLGGGPPPVLVGGVLGSALPPGPPLVGGGCGGCGGLFVICIVVASIFVVCARPPFLFRPAFAVGRVGGACGPRGRRFVVVVVGVFFVVCGFVGHSVDALAPRADEGRCGLRYAPGSWRASFDPGVSEWGNPARVVLGHHHLNVYRVVGGTRGSETSQYP